VNRLRLEGSDRGWKGLTLARRAKKELAESEMAEGGRRWGFSFFPLSLRHLLV